MALHALDLAPAGPIVQDDGLVPWTRVFTGRLVTRAYLLHRQTGRVWEACPHRHRKAKRAEQCARRMLRSIRE